MLPRRLRDEIIEHAAQEAPKECCGLIAGHGNVATRVIRCTNASATPEMRYELKEVRTVLEIEDAGEDLVAIYHSHPRSPAYPSPTDRRDAHWPDAFYVLCSLRSGRAAAELYAYRIKEHDAVTEVKVTE